MAHKASHAKGRHRSRGRSPSPWWYSPFAVVAGAGLALAASPSPGRTVAPGPVQPAVQHVRLDAATETLGQRVLDKAETRTGYWYFFGGSGPWVFDCSGLVYWAARQLGVYVPHSTYSMLAGGSWHLYRIPLSSARRGDLMFYGSGHVEFDTIWYHTTFGAQTWGTQVGWHRWGSWWQPTMAMRFR